MKKYLIGIIIIGIVSYLGYQGYFKKSVLPLPQPTEQQTELTEQTEEIMLGQAATTTVSFATAGYTTWTAPADTTLIQVACWGGGGSGFDGTNSGGGAGGGGGAFASTTVAITGGQTIRIFVGAGGATSGARGATSTASTTVPAALIVAAPGLGATSITTGIGKGGRADSCTGTVSSSGGNGGIGKTDDDGGGGGGGAGGPSGAGEVGADATATTGGAGGRGNATLGGTSGTAGSGGNGGPGGASVLGGGGGGGGDNGTSGGAGGAYGGGGGGGEITPWVGATGACTITYKTDSGGTTPKANQQIINFE